MKNTKQPAGRKRAEAGGACGTVSLAHCAPLMGARAFDLEGCARRKHVAESKPRLGRHDSFLRTLLQEPARRAFRRRTAFASHGKPTGRGSSSVRRGAGYSPRGGCFVEYITAARGGAISCGKGRHGTCHSSVRRARALGSGLWERVTGVRDSNVFLHAFRDRRHAEACSVMARLASLASRACRCHR